MFVSLNKGNKKIANAKGKVLQYLAFLVSINLVNRLHKMTFLTKSYLHYTHFLKKVNTKYTKIYNIT